MALMHARMKEVKAHDCGLEYRTGHDKAGVLLPSGVLVGAAFVGVHMALTDGVTLGMVVSYIPATEGKGIGLVPTGSPPVFIISPA